MNMLSVLLASVAPFTAHLGDPLEWLYPDSPAAESAFAETDVPLNGVCDANVFLTGLKSGVPVAFSCDVVGGEWYRLVDVPVEENTAPGAGVERQGGGYYRNEFVCRRAPFRVFEALEPVASSVVPTGSVLSLRWRLDRLPCAKGVFTANLRVTQGAESRTLPLKVTVHDVRLPAVGKDSFKYTNWISFRNVATRHGLEMWSDAHYEMIEKYMRLAVKGRQNVSWITVGSVFSLEDGKVVFHEDLFNRLLDIYERVGICYVEGGHVAGHTGGQNGSPTFSTVLGKKVTTTLEGEREIAEIIGCFRAAAEKRGLADRWYQHVADEPTRENCKAFLDTCKIVRKHMPKAKLLDAICDDWAMGGLDVVTPQNHVWEQNRGTYDDFAAKHPNGVWCYTCLAPGGRWMNRLMDMELLRPVYIPWCCVLNGIDGYLHWGYNMYGEKQDPFANSCLRNFDFGGGGCTLPAGDTHIVYPGKDGPWPSVRFEAVRAGLEDADLLTMLKARDAAKADSLIRRLVRGFGDYTADPRLYRRVRRMLLEEIAGTVPRSDAMVSVVRLGDASLVRLEEDKLENANPKAIVLETGAAERDSAPAERTVLQRALRIRDTLATLVLRFPQAKVIWKPVFAHGLKQGDPRLIREQQTYHAIATYVKRLKDERLFVCWSGDLKPYLDFAEGRSDKRPDEAPVRAESVGRRTLPYSVDPAVSPHWMIDCSSKVGVPYEARFAKKIFETEVLRGRAVDVVMIGDSITHRFEKGVGTDSWKRLERNYSLLNLGFGGDETQHLLWNVVHGGLLDGYRARVVALMIGTNNWEDEDKTVAGIRACLDEIRRRQPQAKVMLYAILPRFGEKSKTLLAKNERVNDRIRTFADGKDVVWIDLRHLFTDVTPERQRELLPDGCHPSPEAYRLWCVEIEPILRNLVSSVNVVPEDTRVKLMTFDTPESCAGVSLHKWEGENKAYWRFDEVRKSLRLSFTNTGVTMTSPLLNRKIVDLIQTRGAAQRCYVRYRGNWMNGRTDIHFDTPEIYALPLGMRRDGTEHEIIVPIGGDNVKGIPFVPEKLMRIGIVGRGSGDIEVMEVGVIYRGMPDRKLDATPMDIDAVALFPEPKLFTLDGGPLPLSAFAVPQAFGDGTTYAADWFAKEMRTTFGDGAFAAAGGKPITFALKGTSEGKAAFAVCGKDKDLARVRSVGKIVYDGFAILAGQDGIVVVGNEPMGVMNGVRALATLVKQISGDAGPARIRPLTVVDWPLHADRLLHIMMSCWHHLNRYEPDGFSDLLEKFAIDARYNRFAFELGEDYRYESVPGTGVRKQSWDRKDFTHVVDRLNAAGAKVVPYVQSPGHQELGLFSVDGVRTDLREEGGKRTFCMRHPDTYPFLFGVFREIADICAHNPGYKADIFSAGGDEVQWTHGLDYGKRCPRCRDTSCSDLYAEHIAKVNGWCRKNGYTMLLATDMLNDTHNGQNAWKLGDARDKVPNDVAMLHWSGMDYVSIPYWAARGNANWKVRTGYTDDPMGDGQTTGVGLALYNYNFWLSRTRSSHQGNYGLMAIRLVGALGWGPDSAYEGEWKEKTARWGNFLMRNWSRKRIPCGTDSFRTIDLSAAAAQPLGPKLDWGVCELAHVPMAVARDEAGVAVGVAAGERPVTVAVGGKASSFVFLHAAHLPPELKPRFYNRYENYFDWPEGAPTAVWTAKYADGTKADFAVLYGWNVGESEPSLERQQVFERFVTDARYAWSDAAGATVYQHEWVNPHPEKEIVSLTLMRKSKYLEYVLCALSARGTR